MGPAETDRVIRTSVELGTGVAPFLGDESCPPMLVFHNELTAPRVAEDRRAQLDNCRSFLKFLRAHHWRDYVKGDVPAHSLDWRLTLIASPTNIKAMLLFKGLPIAYSGMLFETITPEARSWLGAAVRWGGIWCFFLTDPGPMPPQKQLQALSEQGRALLLAVPLEINANGVG